MKKKAIMVLALAAAMTMSACGANNGGTAEEATSANESSAEENAGEKTTTETKAEKETEETTTEATTAAEPENELFAYYKPLGEEYEKYKGKKVTDYQTFYGSVSVDGFHFFAEYNNVLYFQDMDVSSDGNHDIYSYNIDTKEYKKILDLNSIEFPNGSYVEAPWVTSHIYFLDGYFYVECVTNSIMGRYDLYDLNCYKMDLEGNIVQSASFEQSTLSNMCSDGSIIYSVYNDVDNDNYDYVYSVISPDFKTTTEIKAPEIEAEHGIMEKAGIYDLKADPEGNLYYSAVFDGKTTSFYMKKGTDEWVVLSEFYRIENLAGKYYFVEGENGKAIIDMENGGEVVAESSTDWRDWVDLYTKNYFCGDGNMMLHDGAWYKVQIPSDGSNIDFSQYEPMGKESRDDDNIIPVNDTYYLYHDDYGYFLHTYEKGEEEEETVVLFEK